MAGKCGKTNLQNTFIAVFPHLSIAVGVIIVVVQLVIIALALGSPRVLDLFENVANPGSNETITVVLSTEQRISLGIATFVIIIEAIVFGSIQSYREFKQAVNKASQKQPSGDEADGQSNVPTVGNPLIQEESSSSYSTFNQQSGNYFALHSVMKKSVQSQVAHYVAEVIFNVVDFLWKWTLALLVIRNNWLSVAVAIAGGIGFHVLEIWKSFLRTPLLPIKPPKKSS